MRYLKACIFLLLVVLALSSAVLAANVMWEDGDSLTRGWQRVDGSVAGTVNVSTSYIKQGTGSLQFSVLPPIGKNSWLQFKTDLATPEDWSQMGKLTFDLYNGHTDSIWLSVHVFQGAKKTTLVSYASEKPGWNSVNLTIPGGLAGVTSVILGFNCNESPGHSIYVDNMQLVPATKPPVDPVAIRLYNMKNGDFESGLQGWNYIGAAETTNVAYFGKSGVLLGSEAQLTQFIPLANSAEAPRVGDQVEAGIWVQAPAAATAGSGTVQLITNAVTAQGERKLLSKAEAAQPATGNWFFLKTKSLAPIPANTAYVEVVVQNNLPVSVQVDYVQAGTQYAVKGVPERAVMGHLMPWYSTAQGGWSHWKYGEHDPMRRLINGRLDAASVFYPYIGLYDSADPDVVEYQTDLALAMGLDIIDIDFYGMQLNAWQVGVVDQVIAAAERKGLKVSVRFEPKVHVSGWVPHSSKAEVVDAVAKDIIDIVKRWGNRPGYLHIDGLPVVGTFGMLTLTSAEWQTIYDKIVAAVGDIHLMGDQAPSDSSDPGSWYPMFRSTFKWSLYTPSLNNNLTALGQFVDSMNRMVNRWVAADPTSRMGITIIYPGFDDTAVNGWGSGSRVLGPKTLDFYQTTMASADKSGLKWALVVTLNDWNEGTIVEPAITEQFGFSRAEATRQWVSKFKGVENTYPSVEEVVKGYYDRVFKNRYQ